jgi:hypothetical protein
VKHESAVDSCLIIYSEVIGSDCSYMYLVEAPGIPSPVLLCTCGAQLAQNHQAHTPNKHNKDQMKCNLHLLQSSVRQ